MQPDKPREEVRLTAGGFHSAAKAGGGQTTFFMRKPHYTGLSKPAADKIRSDAGASIVLAMLLFLVCTTVSSIILTSAMTSAGRMADSGKLASRDYAVMSAARLLQNEFTDNMITAEYAVTENDEEIQCDVRNIQLEDGTRPGSILENAAVYMVRDEVLSNYGNSAEPETHAFLLTSDKEHMNCSINETLCNGKASFLISSIPDQATGEMYQIQMDLACMLEEEDMKKKITWKLDRVNAHPSTNQSEEETP